MSQRHTNPNGPQSLLMDGNPVVETAQFTASGFAEQWLGYTGSEVSHYQAHFNGLCEIVGHESPADRVGDMDFVFQRNAPTPGDRTGVADVFLRNKFVMEYKRPGRDLDEAYLQALRYRDALGNPPLIIVCDFETIRVHTNFTGTVSETYYITLEDLMDLASPVRHKSAVGIESQGPLTVYDVLQACFFVPDRLRPPGTPEQLTETAAEIFKEVAAELTRWNPGRDSEIAKFLSQILFAMFASDIGLLPKMQVTRLTEGLEPAPSEVFPNKVATLIEKMSHGARYDSPAIPHFNGGLFDGEPSGISVVPSIIPMLRRADEMDWSHIEPSIFGTLFERVFNPEKRAQFGRHYTSREEIEAIVEPVVMAPLRAEWATIRDAPRGTVNRSRLAIQLQEFVDRVGALKVLDPACGSGNFLYVCLNLLHGLEWEVLRWAIEVGVDAPQTRVHPRQLFGIEIDEYAHQLASVVVWIGHIQHGSRSGSDVISRDPILELLDNIECRDAVVSSNGDSVVPEWPEVDCIVGNPPFLGNKMMRRAMGNDAVDRLYATWDDVVPNGADLCAYWFEKSRQQISDGKARRAGLLATQGIRGGRSRKVLDKIAETGGIFFAISDKPWVLDGANVHISMVGFDDGSDPTRCLDGRAVSTIHSNLTSRNADVTKATRLEANLGIAYQGINRRTQWEISGSMARSWMDAPNPIIETNADVLHPIVTGREINDLSRDRWLIDFGTEMSEDDACKYEKPYEYLRKLFDPQRTDKVNWWENRPMGRAVRGAIAGMQRYLATSHVSKHRIFQWIEAPTLPEHTVVVFARDDDFFFGVLQSRVHQLWASSLGTQLRESASGSRYTHTTCFETFPLPEPRAEARESVAEAADGLHQERTRWLARADSVKPEERARFTMTQLYNEYPRWLVRLHRALDQAVFAAYGWSEDTESLPDDVILERLLELNLERAAAVA